MQQLKWLLLIGAVFVFLLLRYLHFDFDQNFGYLDYQSYWQSVSDVAQGKIIYRDFYWEYV